MTGRPVDDVDRGDGPRTDGGSIGVPSDAVGPAPDEQDDVEDRPVGAWIRDRDSDQWHASVAFDGFVHETTCDRVGPLRAGRDDDPETDVLDAIGTSTIRREDRRIPGALDGRVCPSCVGYWWGREDARRARDDE